MKDSDNLQSAIEARRNQEAQELLNKRTAQIAAIWLALAAVWVVASLVTGKLF